MIGIYCIECNGKKYIGRSRNVKERLASHFSSLNKGTHPCAEMQKDYDKYKKEFKAYVLEECAEDKTYHLEDYYILKFDTINSGYNSKRGDIPQYVSRGLVEKTCSELCDEFKDYRQIGSDRINIWSLSALCHLVQKYVSQYALDNNIKLSDAMSDREVIKFVEGDRTKFYIFVHDLDGYKYQEVDVENALHFKDRYSILVEDYYLPDDIYKYIQAEYLTDGEDDIYLHFLERMATTSENYTDYLIGICDKDELSFDTLMYYDLLHWVSPKYLYENIFKDGDTLFTLDNWSIAPSYFGLNFETYTGKALGHDILAYFERIYRMHFNSNDEVLELMPELVNKDTD